MSDDITTRAGNPVVEAAARRLQEATRTGRQAPPVRDLLGSEDVATAYRVQNLLTAMRLAEGRTVVGRKVGLTSPAVQQQLGVAQPDFGVLFDDMAVADGGTVAMTTLLQPKIEAEVAFVLARDLVEDLTYENVWDSVDHALPALEIVDSRNADWDITITDTVADNASSALYVLGGEPVALSEFSPVDVRMLLRRNGVEVSSGTGADCLGDPVRALQWLAQTVAGLGSPLRAGDVVLSGALGPMVPVAPGDEFTADLTSLGGVSVRFDDRGGEQ